MILYKMVLQRPPRSVEIVGINPFAEPLPKREFQVLLGAELCLEPLHKYIQEI